MILGDDNGSGCVIFNQGEDRWCRLKICMLEKSHIPTYIADTYHDNRLYISNFYRKR